MKKKIALLLTATLLLCSCGNAQQGTADFDAGASSTEASIENYDYSAYSEVIKYNENPDISSKTMPSAYESSSSELPNTTEEMMVNASGYKAYGVAVIRILDNSRIEEASPTGNADLDEELGLETAKVKIATAEVLYSVCGGHKKGDTINVSQYTENYGVNLVVGKEYLIITKEIVVDGEYRYPPIRGIHTLFEIKDDFTVYTDSPLYTTSKYDGLTLADTAHDLNVAFEAVCSDDSQ